MVPAKVTSKWSFTFLFWDESWKWILEKYDLFMTTMGTLIKVLISQLLSLVHLFAIPWTVAHQSPPSIGFSRQEYWSGSPFSSPGDLSDLGIEPRFLSLRADSLSSDPPGKPKNTGRGSLCLLQWIFRTQDSNQGHLHFRRIFTNWPIREEMQNSKGVKFTAPPPLFCISFSLNLIEIFLCHFSWKSTGASLMAQMIKEFACNAGDPGSVLESGRCPGGWHGNPLQ